MRRPHRWEVESKVFIEQIQESKKRWYQVILCVSDGNIKKPGSVGMAIKYHPTE